MIDCTILYEDDDILAIDKPAGIVVNRAESVKGETVQDWVERYLQISNLKSQISNKFEDEKVNDQDSFGFRDLNLEFLQRAGIVHRIDKETSGLLLIVKNPESFRNLQMQFQNRSIQKTYLAIVHGHVKPPEGDIRAPVGRLPWNRERFGIVPEGKEAETSYKVQRSWVIVHSKTEKEEMTLLELHPATGRTHQIRVHLKYINHPILGDYLYAGRKTARSDRLWAKRVMLHAWKIRLLHPKTRVLLALEAAIPDDMMRIITQSLYP